MNAASFAPAPIPVAPGSIVTIFGVNLASSTAQAAGIPLPTDLGGASVTINGAPAPLFFASAGQINAQVPFETSPGQATAVVTTAAGVSKGETFNVAAAAVGIFQFFGTNRAIVLNQDFTINAPENPEAKGNVVVAFLTGQGMVNPAVGTGQAAPSDTLSRPLLPVGATVGGQSANVLFLGLTPGFVGLAQANIQVPAGIATGNSVAMSVSVGSAVSNSTTISVK